MNASVPMLSPEASHLYICATNTLVWYMLIAALLYKLNGRRFRFARGALYAAVMTALLFVPNQWLQWMPGLIQPEAELSRCAILHTDSLFRGPAWLVVSSAMALWILKLPRQGMMNLAVMLFCVQQVTALVSIALEYGHQIFMDNRGRDAGFGIGRFNAFDDAAAALILGPCTLLLLRYVARNPQKIKAFMESQDASPMRIAAISGVQVFALWLLAAGYASLSRYAFFRDEIHLYYVCAMMLVHGLVIFLNYNLMLKSHQSKYLAESNKQLASSMDSFRGIRHDFTNILQSYEGYFALGDFEGLKRHHRVLFEKTASAGNHMLLQEMFGACPAIWGQMISAFGYAEAHKVHLGVLRVERLQDFGMSEFDLCRVLGILLCNAIEHAAQTKARIVTFSAVARSKDRGIIVITNSVDAKVDCADLFREGYTTKRGHSGHGLVEVNRILSEYYGCNIMSSCTEDTFTMCLSAPLRPNGEPHATAQEESSERAASLA